MDDGGVIVLEQWLTKQLFKSDDDRMFIKDSAECSICQGLVSWKSQLQNYVKREATLAVDGRDVVFEAYLLQVRTGAGCAEMWRGPCFLTALAVQGYGA